MLLKNRLLSIGSCIMGVAIFCVCIAVLGMPDKTILAKIDVFWLCVAIISQALLITFVAARWRMLLASAQISLAMGAAWRMVSIFTLVSLILPRDLADVGGRGFWLAKHINTNVAAACHLTLCDRLFELFLFLLMLPASFMFLAGAPFSVSFLVAGVSVIVGAVSIFILQNRFFFFFNLAFAVFGKLCSYVPFFRERIDWKITPPAAPRERLLAAYGLTLVKFFVTVVYTLACFKIVGFHLDWTAIILILPATQLAFLISFAPGGLGVVELSWIAVLKTATALSHADISLYLIAQRLCVTVGSAVCALSALAISSGRASELKSGDRSR